MLKNSRNLVSQKASKVQKEREETIKQSKNKKKKIKEPAPEQDLDIPEEDVSEREKGTTLEEESEIESSVMSSQAKPKRKCQDEVNFHPADA